MSTSSPHTPPTFDEIKGALHQIGHHLLQAQAPLLPDYKPSAEQAYLERVNASLKLYHQAFLHKSRALYQALHGSDLRSAQGTTSVAQLKTSLNAQLLDMDLRDPLGGKPRKSFMTYDAGFTALEKEARLGVRDRLLDPQDSAIVERLTLAPPRRPGVYALRFGYQSETVELAGAFVVTEKNSPEVTDLAATEVLGRVLLYTPLRGIEPFDSLAELNDRLVQLFDHPTSHSEFVTLLPKRFHALTAAGIWPLTLSPISDKPLFEHVFDAQVAKRTQDIERALSFADNPDQDPAALVDALDCAIAVTPPDFSARLELRAQALLERHLRLTAPDWYRSANEVQHAALADHLGQYNRARQTLLDLLGPVTTPYALARHQWLERLSDELEIDDLLPEHLLVMTSRTMATLGSVDHQRNLIELALRGPHTGDELAGSEFLQKTTLTYYGKTLPEAYQDLTPAWLARQLLTLQPRIDFADLQKQLHAREETRTAVEHMLDRRMNALAYVAVLQGDLSDEDFQLIQRLRDGSDPQLSAASLGASGLSLHGAHLQDLWVLRQTDADGEVKRLLLCTPEAPRAQQFQAFTREADCQSHILGWAIEKGFETPGSMANYLITRAPVRFRRTLQTVLEALSFKPDDLEYQKIAFNPAASHQDCLRSMADHILRTRVDDYQFSTPDWYRSASVEARRTLVTLNENIENALRQYNRQEFSELSFPSFTTYLHEQATLQLNRLLGRPQNDVDPDTVWAYSPSAIVGIWTPAPQTYTQLFRDGYADGIGFLDEKFSRSARFRGPQGIDLSPLTAESVARSVTGVWIGQRYINHVRSVLLDPDDASYDFRRKTTLAITQWQMHSAAIESQLQGHIASVDLQWLESSIASIGDRSASKRNTYALHRLMIDGEWVIDTWLFSHADNPVLLYTPQAPDGISFRPARLFNYLLKKQPGMIAYLTERVGVQSRTRVQAFLEDAQRKLPEQLDKTSVSPARYDSTRAVPVVTDLRLALYNMKLQRKIDDVAATTVNRTQMITGILWTCVEWVTAIATAPFPILSLSAGLLLAFKDAMLALHAYNQGDTSAAFEHYLGYLFNSSGALLTDLRPALRSLHPSPKPLRLSSGATEQRRALQLIKQLEPTRPSPAGMQPVLFEGRSLWAPKMPDAIGRYLLYRLDPESGRLISTSRLATPTTEGAWRRSGVAGGNPPRYEGVGQTPHPHTDYGLPAEHCVDIEQFLNPQMKSMLSMHADLLAIPVQTHLDNLSLALRPVRGAYQEQVMRLATDAQAFFQRFVPLPAVVDTPAIDASSTFTQLLSSQAFTGNKHLVVGAVPGSIASKQVLITHMDALIDQGFKTLYVEYLPGDVFATKLDNLNHGKTWKHIKQHLKAIDAEFGLASNAEYSYLSLVRQARAKGMKVKAIDVTTSYHLDSALILGDTPPTTPRANSLRNFYSHKVLEADSADVPQERWIALVEQSRLGTYNGTPGLADLQEAVALRIEDVAADQPVGIWLDAPGAIPGDALAKGDYRMTVQTAFKAAEPIVPSPAAPTVVAAHFDEFDIPAPLKENVARLADQPHGLDSRYAPFQPASFEAYTAFVRTRAKLQIAADSFFVDYAAPSRLPMPVVSAGTPPEAFLKQIAESPFSGLVIGEGHGHQSSKALLRTQMKAIKDAGYKTLYIEHLFTDLHQAELDIFQRTQRLPDALKARLRQLDVGHMPFYSGPDNYTQVVQAANKYGLRVRALDCTASYHVKGMEDTGESRNKMFSYFASKVIEADQAAQGPHKWIAFVGSAHTNINRGVPGLAEMQGAVSLHVRDTTPALARGIHVGGAETVQHRIASQSVVLISDFKLEVAKT